MLMYALDLAILAAESEPLTFAWQADKEQLQVNLTTMPKAA